MKKKDICISLIIIVVSSGALYFYIQRTGSIRLDTGDAEATLDLRSSLLSQSTIRSTQQPVEVHARIHRPRHLRLSMNQERHEYVMLSQGPWGDLAKITVKNNQKTSLRLGPPFMIKPKVQKRNSVVEIQFDIVGQAGEQYEKFVRKNNRAVTRASLKILDEVGNLLESGKFRFG